MNEPVIILFIALISILGGHHLQRAVQFGITITDYIDHHSLLRRVRVRIIVYQLQATTDGGREGFLEAVSFSW